MKISVPRVVRFDMFVKDFTGFVQLPQNVAVDCPPNGTRKPRPRVQLHGGDLNQRQNHKGNSSAACYLSDCHSVTSRK